MAPGAARMRYCDRGDCRSHRDGYFNRKRLRNAAAPFAFATAGRDFEFGRVGYRFCGLAHPRVGRWSMGDVNLSLVLKLPVGSLSGVYVGSKLCGRLSQSWLRPVVSVTLVFVGMRLVKPRLKRADG